MYVREPAAFKNNVINQYLHLIVKNSVIYAESMFQWLINYWSDLQVNSVHFADTF